MLIPEHAPTTDSCLLLCPRPRLEAPLPVPGGRHARNTAGDGEDRTTAVPIPTFFPNSGDRSRATPSYPTLAGIEGAGQGEVGQPGGRDGRRAV